MIEAPDTDAGLEAIARLVSDQGADSVVVGLPVTLSGADSEQTVEARRFAERLRAALAVPVETYDERFTTRLAQRTPGRAPEDSRAAAHLLEGYLTALDRP